MIHLGKKASTAVPVLCAVSLALGACNADSAPAGTIHTDSAGVGIATAVAPRWGPGEGWTVSGTPTLDIGRVSGDSEYLFDHVIGAVRLSTGDIVIGDRGSGELRRYDSGGTFVWRAAGSGEGPGEHRFLSFLGLLPGDSLVTNSGRIQIFSPDGQFVRGLRFDPPTGLRPSLVFGASARHLAMTFSDPGTLAREGIVRWPGLHIATFSLADGTVRILSDVPGAEWSVTAREDGGFAIGRYHFAKGPRFAFVPERLAVVDTEAFNVRWLSLEDGSITRILRRTDPLPEVTSAHVEALEPEQRDEPRAPNLPALRSIQLDAAGNLWVEPYVVPGAESLPFEVYDREGVWLGSVAMPPGLRQGLSSAPSLWIGEDYVLGVWVDELEVEYVRMYELVKEN